MQERCNSIANALELHLSCTNPSISTLSMLQSVHTIISSITLVQVCKHKTHFSDIWCRTSTVLLTRSIPYASDISLRCRNLDSLIKGVMTSFTVMMKITTFMSVINFASPSAFGFPCEESCNYIHERPCIPWRKCQWRGVDVAAILFRLYEWVWQGWSLVFQMLCPAVSFVSVIYETCNGVLIAVWQPCRTASCILVS